MKPVTGEKEGMSIMEIVVMTEGAVETGEAVAAAATEEVVEEVEVVVAIEEVADREEEEIKEISHDPSRRIWAVRQRRNITILGIELKARS